MSNSPAPRVVLHIGAPKTGTTYLQSMLWRNRRALARQGVHLPGIRQFDHYQAGRAVLEWQRAPSNPYPPWEGAFDELVAEIRRSGAHTGIISSEDLVRAAPAQVERTFARLDGCTVDVVYGTRSFAGQLTSQWQESVKNASRRDLPEWLARCRQRDPSDAFWRVNDLPAVVQHWQPPQGRFHVVMVPGPDAPVDELWRRFVQVVGTTPTRTTYVRRRNESLGYVEASLLVRVQSALPRKSSRNHIRDILKGVLVTRALQRAPNDVPIRLPTSEQAWVKEVTSQRRETISRQNVTLIGDPVELNIDSASFGALSLEGAGPKVVSVIRSSLVALLAFEDRQRTTLRWLEASSRWGKTVVGAVDSLRILTDYKSPVVRRRRYDSMADERLAAAGVSVDDPVSALDAGGELIAALLVGQARRSIRIGKIVGPGRGAFLRRIATALGR
ncbi:MAG: hypothetical protein ACR2PK_06295 [Acidimicrobiales bacterium]